MDSDAIVQTMRSISAGMESVLSGKTDQIRTTLVVLLAGGHLLIEDVPGVGKTVLAKALGRCICGRVNRIQFTPDLLPGDLTGVSVFNQATRSFEFKKGALFAHIVVGDEINRASPKTQSAMLEAMAEYQVSVDSTTYPLASPYMVVATQNPIELEGTYPLPEAQLDRFMAKISMGYPAKDAEKMMLANRNGSDPLDALSPITDVETIASYITQICALYVAEPIRDLVVDIVAATRTHPDLRLGASPRSGLHLLAAGRALAALSRRDYVIPEDIVSLAVPVLAHRVVLHPQARLAGKTKESVVTRIVNAAHAAAKA